MNKRITPLPEAIDGKPWTVGAGSGSCDTVNRVLRVPLDDSAAARFVRNHELGHARITPRVPAWKQCVKFGVSMDALQVCEDLRVHLYLRKKGIDMCGTLTDEEAQSIVNKSLHSDRLLVAHLVASLHTADYPRLFSAIFIALECSRIERLVQMCGLVDSRMGVARGLDRYIGLRNGTIPAARLFDELVPENGSAGSTIPHAGVPMHRRGVKWGEMTVERLPYERSRRIPALARERSFVDHGSVLGAAHRLPVDGKVFTRNRRRRGGTVLVDTSGSMRMGEEELEKIVALFPLATVAVYGGLGRSGRLSLVAFKGRMVSAHWLESLRFGRGNVVDGPALRWLAEQQEPRIWISDGQVTGVHDRSSMDLVVEAMGICRRNRITRVDKSESLHKLARLHHGASR